MESLGLGDDIKKVIAASGIVRLADATREYFSWGWGGGFTIKDENCTPCMVRQTWLNKLIPYDKKMTVRFLKDYQMRHQDKLLFEAKAGDVVDVNGSHPIYPVLMNLCDAKKVEEVA